MSWPRFCSPPPHTHLSTVKSQWRFLKVGHSPGKHFATLHQFSPGKSVFWRSSVQRAAAAEMGHCLPATMTGLPEDSLGWWWLSSCPLLLHHGHWLLRSWLLPQPAAPSPFAAEQHAGVLYGSFLGGGYLPLQLNIAIARTQ